MAHLQECFAALHVKAVECNLVPAPLEAFQAFARICAGEVVRADVDLVITELLGVERDAGKR